MSHSQPHGYSENQGVNNQYNFESHASSSFRKSVKWVGLRITGKRLLSFLYLLRDDMQRPNYALLESPPYEDEYLVELYNYAPRYSE